MIYVILSDFNDAKTVQAEEIENGDLYIMTVTKHVFPETVWQRSIKKDSEGAIVYEEIDGQQIPATVSKHVEVPITEESLHTKFGTNFVSAVALEGRYLSGQWSVKVNEPINDSLFVYENVESFASDMARLTGSDTDTVLEFRLVGHILETPVYSIESNSTSIYNRD